MVTMSKPELMLKELGEPIVRAAFDEVLRSDIPSKKARQVITQFRRKWKDYARPALMMLVCEAVGGDPRLVEPVAKAMVLTAGALDIHDDIIDKTFTKTEKQKKTLLGIHGQETMLLAGDALMIGALTYLPSLHCTLPHEKVMQISETIRSGLFELGSAELEELKFIRNYNTTPRQYLSVVRMKAADVESYTKIGAIIGGADDAVANKYGEFGRLLGIITILRDDIEDTFYDRHELSSRIIKESLPLPIVFSLHDPQLVNLLSNIKTNPKNSELDQILKIVNKNQGFEKTKKVIEMYQKEVLKILSTLPNNKKLVALFT